MRTQHPKSGTYVTTLSDFGGLDLTGGDASSPMRFSRLDNMWRDYHAGDGDAPESFPGFRILTHLDGAVHGIWQWRHGSSHYILVHAGSSLYIGDYAATDGTKLTQPLTIVTGSNGALADISSVGFSFGDAFYLLDTAHYFVIRETDGIVRLSPVSDLYTPVTYSDGSPYEQRNLLSRHAVNRYHITDHTLYPCGSRGLRYCITDYTNRLCEVRGYTEEIQNGILYIPAETVIGGLPYRVTAVGYKAFFNATHLLDVYISEGVEVVKESAFEGCTSLERVFLADSIRHLSKRAFSCCTGQISLILGSQLATVGTTIAEDASALYLFYHGDEDTFNAIQIDAGNDALLNAPRNYLSHPAMKFCCFPVTEPAESVTGVTLDGVSIGTATGSAMRYTVEYNRDGYVDSVILTANGATPLIDRELHITLRYGEQPIFEGDGAFAATDTYDGTVQDAVAECRIAEIYDGRIFFSGNPRLPSTIFYTARDLSGQINPAYIGSYNYFSPGDDTAPVTALLATGGHLAVLSGATVGNGEITYYRGSDTDRNLVPRIYVVADRVRGRCCVGAATLFRDDPVYLSDEGLEAVSREALNTERSLKHRSSLIDPALTAEDASAVLHTVWDGYLVLLFPDGEAYLADSRRTAATDRGQEYEWYHLNSIGCYTDDLPVYRYADGYTDTSPDTIMYLEQKTRLRLHPTADALPYESTYDTYSTVYPRLYAGTNTQGKDVYYTVEGPAHDPHLFLLRRTEERTGGVFSPPSALAALGEKLFFGCENGCLAVVNTDRRGVMNDHQAEVYTPYVWRRQWGRLINPEWYSYGGHRYLAGLATLPDDNGISNYTKGTLRGTTVLEMKGGVGLGFSIEVRLFRTADMEVKDLLRVEQGGLDFTALDFSGINFGACEDCTVTLRERSRRYLKKQYCLFSDAFARPFGLRSLSYTWRPEGRVKNV